MDFCGIDILGTGHGTLGIMAFSDALLWHLMRSDDILSDWRGTCLAQGKVKMVSKPA